jgi:hypothetical protein
LDHTLAVGEYFDDVNGTPAYKRHITYHFAEAIRAELATGARSTSSAGRA